MSLSEKEILEYECGSCSFIFSCIYFILPKYHQWLIKRKMKRYLEYINLKNKI